MIKKTSQSTIAQIILYFLSVLAILAGVSALAELNGTASDTLVVETWRIVGLFTFAGLFALLARRPNSGRGLWSIVIANKLALAVAGLIFTVQPSKAAGASDLIIFDGSITILLVIASVLAGVWSISKK